jgi:hypothetical protein
MRQSRKPEQLNSFTSSSGTASSPAVAAPPPSRRRNQQETLNMFAASPASLTRSEGSEAAAAADVPPSASLTRSAALRGGPESLNLFASAGRDVARRPRVELPPLRPRVDAMAMDYGIDDAGDAAPLRPRAAPPPPLLPPPPVAPASPPINLRVRDPLSLLSPAPLSRAPLSRSPIQDFSDEIATLAILFQSEVSLTPEQIFVNILPRPSNHFSIGYKDYVGSVLQFIFTNKIWRQFFTIKAIHIMEMVEEIMVTQHTLNDTQVILFIRIIKYILILYISSSTVESRGDDCLITWTDDALTAYDVLCKHLMINIRSITVPINSFETLLSTILDCMPLVLRPSVTTEDGGRVPTKFIKLPAVITSLEDHLRNITVFSEDYFVVFYDNGQNIPVPEEFDFSALNDIDCPGRVTLQNGVIYRKLIHIDSRYSAEIASPTSPNGEVMFVTNRMGVVPREVGGGLKQSLFTVLGYGPKTKKCDGLLNLIFEAGRTRLVVMYEKTTVQPQGRATRVIAAANTLLAPVTDRHALVANIASASYGIFDYLYNDPSSDFSQRTNFSKVV